MNYVYGETNYVRVYYDWTGRKVYQEVNLSVKATGGGYFGEDDVDETELYKTYGVIDGGVLRTAHYADGLGWNALQEDYGAAANLKSSLQENVGTVSVFNDFSYAQDLDASFCRLEDIYGWFEYDDGLYTAELYVNSQNGKTDKETVTLAVTDGRVSRLQFSFTAEKTALGLTEKTETATVYLFDGFGETTVTPPAKAVEALNSLKDGGDAVAGKTYLFESVELIYDDEELKSQIWDKFLNLMETSYEGAALSFGEWRDFVLDFACDDGLTVKGFYTGDGNIITATPESKGGQDVDDDPMICVVTNGFVTVTQEVGDGVYMLMVFALTE